MRLPKNTYKLAWFVDPDSADNMLSSKLYRNKRNALEMAKLLDGHWLLMQLMFQNPYPDNNFYWRILPYGSYKTFRRGLGMAKLFGANPVEPKSNLINEGVTTEVREETVKEFQKSQYVRILDMVLVAPLLIYAGTRKELPMWMRASLIAIGAATFIYNGSNYVKNLRSEPLKTAA